MDHFLIKLVAVFALGAVFALLVFQVAGNPQVLGSFTKMFEKKVARVGNERVEYAKAKAGGQVRGVSVEGSVQGIVEGLFSKNSAFAPLFKTTRDVQQAVDSVISLPEEQRSSICRQICQ